MTRILVTGGGGSLGSELTPRLAGSTVRVMSHSAPRADRSPNLEWAQADLATGVGLAEAVKDVDIIVHAASSGVKNTHQVDVLGTQKMLEYARAAGIAHVVYISIIGIERIPFAYYEHKVATEKVVRDSGVPWSILRAAQFHGFIDFILAGFNRLPLALFIPTDWKSQPIDVGEVAQRLVEVVAAPPAGMLPDIGGPEVLRLDEMARVWMQVQGIRRPIIHMPIPTKWASGFRQGLNTDLNARYGKITWAQWVQHKYARTSTSTPERIGAR